MGFLKWLLEVKGFRHVVIWQNLLGHWFPWESLVLIFQSVSGPVDMLPFAVGGENGERETGVKDAEHWRSRRARSACP
jgi:hypothetical protein